MNRCQTKARQPSARQRHAPAGPALLFSLALLWSVAPFATDGVPGLVSAEVRELHTSAAAVQLTLTSSLIGVAVGQLFLGPRSDRYGRRRPLLICTAVGTSTSGMCAVCPTSSLGRIALCPRLRRVGWHRHLARRVVRPAPRAPSSEGNVDAEQHHPHRADDRSAVRRRARTDRGMARRVLGLDRSFTRDDGGNRPSRSRRVTPGPPATPRQDPLDPPGLASTELSPGMAPGGYLPSGVAVRIFFAALLLGSVALLRPSTRVVSPLLLATTSIVSFSFANATSMALARARLALGSGRRSCGLFSSPLGAIASLIVGIAGPDTAVSMATTC